jgi:phosphoglycolate phosphatase
MMTLSYTSKGSYCHDPIVNVPVSAGKMGIEAILFDKDGTLFDFEASWADWMAETIVRLARGDAGLERALAVRLRFDLPARRFSCDSPVIAGTLHDTVPLIEPLLPFMSAERIAEDLQSSAAVAPMLPTVPLDPLLRGLRQDGYALGVATNATRSELDAHLDAAGIELAFDFLVGCDSGHGAKPGPGMCLAFAAHLGCAPGAVVMVGDSLHDLKAGRAAGMRTVGVLTGLARRDELLPFADAVLADIGALPGWLSTGAQVMARG